jgi:polyhydroxybutyrate depolymerase
MRLFFPLVALLAACPTPEPEPDEPEPTPLPPRVDFPLEIGGDRDALVLGPEDWRGVEPLPVVTLLHGFQASGQSQDLLFRLGNQVEDKRFLLILPDGTTDESGRRFWNATDACCDFDDLQPDDSAYLMGLVDELAAAYEGIDQDRVYFTGHSNGGFMSYRMACDHPDRIAAVAPLAGAVWLDPADCAGGDPVSVLHMHGDQDPDVPWDGDPGRHPSVMESVQRWVDRDGCGAPTDGGRLDLVGALDGDETSVQAWSDCDPGYAVELWRIEGGGHVPIFNNAFGGHLIDWLFERTR